MPKIKFAETEITEQTNNEIKRYPTLKTVMMVEDYIKNHRDIPIKLPELKRKLPKQIMHQTLKVILEYFFPPPVTPFLFLIL